MRGDLLPAHLRLPMRPWRQKRPGPATPTRPEVAARGPPREGTGAVAAGGRVGEGRRRLGNFQKHTQRCVIARVSVYGCRYDYENEYEHESMQIRMGTH